jgi:cell division transport system permease protein
VLGRGSDLSFERDPLARFLPWLIAFMAYLAVLALAGVQMLNTTVGDWHRDLNGALTVQIPAAETAEGDDANVSAVMDILLDTVNVSHAEVVSEDRVVTLLEPWLGDTDMARELPLPLLIDVTVRPDRPLDFDTLRARIEESVPGATIDNHGVWLSHLVRLIRTTEIVTVVVLALIGLITSGTVVFATRTGLAIHHDAIELMHIIGARDSYVAWQFARRALVLGLKGGLIGLAFGASTLFALGRLAARLQGGTPLELGLAPEHWMVLALVPVTVALIAMLTARVTVIRSLTSML